MKLSLSESFRGEFSTLSPLVFMAKAHEGLCEAMAKAGVERPVDPLMDGRVKALAEVEQHMLDTYERVTKRALRRMVRRISKGLDDG